MSLVSCSGVHDEAAVHVLYECAFHGICGQDYGSLFTIMPYYTALEVLKLIFSKGNKEQSPLIGLFCWSLWNRRNKWVWDRVIVSVFGLKAASLNLLAQWKRAGEEEVTHIICSIKLVSGLGLNLLFVAKVWSLWVWGVPCVIQDGRGKFIRARSNKMNWGAATKRGRGAELEGTRVKCIFESDAKLLVDTCNGERDYSYSHTIVTDCIDLLKHFDEVLVVFAQGYVVNNEAHLLVRAEFSGMIIS